MHSFDEADTSDEEVAFYWAISQVIVIFLMRLMLIFSSYKIVPPDFFQESEFYLVLECCSIISYMSK